MSARLCLYEIFLTLPTFSSPLLISITLILDFDPIKPALSKKCTTLPPSHKKDGLVGSKSKISVIDISNGDEKVGKVRNISYKHNLADISQRPSEYKKGSTVQGRNDSLGKDWILSTLWNHHKKLSNDTFGNSTVSEGEDLMFQKEEPLKKDSGLSIHEATFGLTKWKNWTYQNILESQKSVDDVLPTKELQNSQSLGRGRVPGLLTQHQITVIDIGRQISSSTKDGINQSQTWYYKDQYWQDFTFDLIINAIDLRQTNKPKASGIYSNSDIKTKDSKTSAETSAFLDLESSVSSSCTQKEPSLDNGRQLISYDNIDKSKTIVFDLLWSKVTVNNRCTKLQYQVPEIGTKISCPKTSTNVQEPSGKRLRSSIIVTTQFLNTCNNPRPKNRKVDQYLENNVESKKPANKVNCEGKDGNNNLKKAGPASRKMETTHRRAGPASRRPTQSN
jgi:hypothetical protein